MPQISLQVDCEPVTYAMALQHCKKTADPSPHHDLPSCLLAIECESAVFGGDANDKHLKRQ
jgi:hypothetical protein